MKGGRKRTEPESYITKHGVELAYSAFLPSPGTEKATAPEEKSCARVLMVFVFDHDAMRQEQWHMSSYSPVRLVLAMRSCLGWRPSSTEPDQFLSPPHARLAVALLAAELFCFTAGTRFATTGFCLCAVHKSPASGLAPFQVLTSAVPKKVARD